MLPGIAHAVMASAPSGGSLSASVSQSTITKTASNRTGSSQTVTSSTVTVTASGGSGGYSYSWARTAGDAGITATAPSAATTAFSASLAPDTSKSATFVCTITDASGAVQTATVEVTLSLIYTDISGGTL